MKIERRFPYESEFTDDLIYYYILNDREFICDGDNREVCSTYEDDE